MSADYSWKSATRLASECPMCGAPLRRRKGPKGDFLGCTKFPGCKFTEDVDLNLERIKREMDRLQSDNEALRTENEQLRSRGRK